MDRKRRNIVISGLVIISQYFLKINLARACIGDGPYITKIRDKDLKNLKFLGYKEYLDSLFPSGYEYSSHISIRGFTTVDNRKHINILTGELYNGEIYHLESELRLTISLASIAKELRCKNIRVIFQDNYIIGKGPCFEVARFNLTERSMPTITAQIKQLSGQNPSFFVVAEVNAGTKSKILVSNIYLFKGVCDGSNYLEIITS